MLRRKALRKIFITTLTAFIILVISVFPVKFNEKTLNTSLEVEYLTGLGTNTIYLLNKDNLLVKTKIFLDSKDKIEQVRTILDNLKIKDSSNFLGGLYATIPSNVVVNNITYNDNIITVDFSEEFNSISKNKEKAIISSIVYSIMDLKEINGVKILVEGNPLESYPKSKEALPEILTKDIGINEKSNITSRNNITKVVVYYLEDIDNNRYYVPVTKYLNDDREKINIIIDELTTSYIYETNLMSFLNSNLKLENKEEKENVMFLNFNNLLLDHDDKVLEEVKYALAYSVFENYDVNSVVFMVDNNVVDQVNVNDEN